MSRGDCDGLVAFWGSEDGAEVEFTLVGATTQSMGYVAVGISTDDEMVAWKRRGSGGVGMEEWRILM